MWSLGKCTFLKKNLLSISVWSLTQISVAMTFIWRVNPIQCFANVNVTFYARTSASLSRPPGRKADMLRNQNGGMDVGRARGCHMQVSHLPPREAVRRKCCVWGWSVPRNIPYYEEGKKHARDLYFVQPDIKKITKNKSIRGENCIFSLTHFSLLHFLSVSLYLLSSTACVRVSVCTTVCAQMCV